MHERQGYLGVVPAAQHNETVLNIEPRDVACRIGLRESLNNTYTRVVLDARWIHDEMLVPEHKRSHNRQ